MGKVAEGRKRSRPQAILSGVLGFLGASLTQQDTAPSAPGSSTALVPSDASSALSVAENSLPALIFSSETGDPVFTLPAIVSDKVFQNS